MAVKLEDYFRTTYDEKPLLRLPVVGRCLIAGATRMLEKHKASTEVDKKLQARREVLRREFEAKRKSMRQHRDELRLKEEKLKESLKNFDIFLKENDAKRSRGAQKAEKERQVVLQKEREIERLKIECTALDRRRQKLQSRVQRNHLYCNFLEQALKMTTFEEVRELLSRFETLLVTRDQLRQRESEVQEKADGHRGALQRLTERQNRLLLQQNNLLSQLQSQLDHTRSEALRWESKWNLIQRTAAAETLLLGQIKMVTFNLYQMTGGEVGKGQGVAIDDTEEQLHRVQIFLQKQGEIVNDAQPLDIRLD